MEPETPSSSLGKAPATPESVAAARGGGRGGRRPRRGAAATSPASAADAQRALLLQQQQMFQQQQQLLQQQQQQQQQQMAAGFSPGSFGGPRELRREFRVGRIRAGRAALRHVPARAQQRRDAPAALRQSPPTSQLSAIGLAAGMQQAAAAAAAAAVQLPTLQPGVASPGRARVFPFGAGRAARRQAPPAGAGGASAFAGFGPQQQPPGARARDGARRV